MSPLRITATAILPFAAGYFMSYLLRAVNAVVAPDLMRDVGLTPAGLGLLTAAYLGAFALFQLPLGVLLDRFGPRRVQSALLGVAGVGCLAFAASPGFLPLFLSRAMIGLGFSAGLMAGYKSTATWVPIERRSLANTAIMSFGALGVVVATEPTEWLVGITGWRGAFTVFAVMIFAAALLIFAVTPRADAPSAATTPLAQQFAEMAAIARLPVFRRLAPLLALTSGVQIGIQTLWTGPWYHDVLGFDRAGVAQHLLWMALSFMVGIFLVGLIADRLGRLGIGPVKVMLGFNVIYFLAQSLIVLRVEALAVPAWLMIAAFGQVAILAYPVLAAEVGAGLAGRSNATINFAMFVMAFCAQYAAGLLIGLYPATAEGYDPRGYSLAIGLFLLLQLAAFAWYLMPRTSPNRTP
jgi:predicted MFS family arabinose efflux permease